MKVEIEFISQADSGACGWKVTHGDKYASELAYEEMLGLVTAIIMPLMSQTRCLSWLKTEAQHKLEKSFFESEKSSEVSYEEHSESTENTEG